MTTAAAGCRLGLLAALVLAATVALAEPANHVLDLDGDGDAVRLPGELLAGIDEVTIEAWVRWRRLGRFSQPFGFGRAWQGIFLSNAASDLQFYSYLGEDHLELIAAPDIIRLGTWHHIAAIVTQDSMRLFLDGVLVGERTAGAVLVSQGSTPENLLGGTHWADNDDFNGQLDEIRIWRHARTQAQIRRDMHRPLRGDEAGLQALWDFDVEVGRDSGPHGFHGMPAGDARAIAEDLPQSTEHTAPIALWGLVRDEAGRPLPNAVVELHGDEQARRTLTDGGGRYRLLSYSDLVDLSVTHGERGAWREGLALTRGTGLQVDLDLSPAVDIEGRLEALDGSPIAAVPVQALRQGSPPSAMVTTVSSSADGSYRFVNLRPGLYRIRALTPDGPLDYTRAVPVGDAPGAGPVDFRFAPFKKGTWREHTSLEMLSRHGLSAVHQAANGVLWIGTIGGGLFRFDGYAFRRLTTCDGLVGNSINDLYEDDEGALWIATSEGVSRLVNDAFTNLTRATHGLPSNSIKTLARTEGGTLWLATLPGGRLARCEPKADGRLSCSAIVDERVRAISSLLEAPDGILWIGTRHGLLRHDGGGLTAFSVEDGLPSREVTALGRDGQGRLWVGTRAGLARFDGADFARLTQRDGLPAGPVLSLHCGADGILWVGTHGGLSRIDASAWHGGVDPGEALHIANFSVGDGLASGAIRGIHRSRGALWAISDGLSHYDEEGVLHYTTADGLPGNVVSALHRDEDGVLWVGTSGGLARLANGRMTSFDVTDGLPRGPVTAVHRPAGGDLWLATKSGIARFDGTRFTAFDRRQGLKMGQFSAIQGAPDGSVWFAHRFGLYTFDGKSFARFSAADGLPARGGINDIFRDGDDTMWVGTSDGLARYDGTRFESYNEKVGVSGPVRAIFRDRHGVLWLGTRDGLARYDGTDCELFTEGDGAAVGSVSAIAQAPWGPLCLGTAHGLCLFDGQSWTTLDRRDGMAGLRIIDLLVDPDGDLWLGSEGGLTRYRHRSSPPQARVVSVQADRLYADLSTLPQIERGHRVTVTYDALDPQGRAGEGQFRRRLVGPRGEAVLDWHNTRESALDIAFAKAGEYLFEVRAISRHLEYSPVAAIGLTVVKPWYARLWVLLGAAGGLAALIGSSLVNFSRYYLQRREAGRLREQVLEQEQRARTELESAYSEVQRLLRTEERTAAILRGWAHAVKSPLTIIRRQLDQQDRDAELRRRMGTIVETVDRILGAAVDIQRRHFDLRSELNLLLYRTVKEYPGVEMEAGGGEAVRVHVDHAKVMMAFENLFRNACQSLDGGGIIGLTMEEDDQGVLVEVADNGPGIAEEIRDRLFERTVTTRKDRGGTGLGLLIAQHVIDAHGGRIWVEATSAEGTAICVQLPHSQ